jgi:hypothetical protein
MQQLRRIIGGVCVLAGLIRPGAATAQTSVAEIPTVVNDMRAIRPVALMRPRATSSVPLEAIPAGWRDQVAKVVQQPTLTAHAGPEEVRGRFYDWLLEHPDRACVAWRRLGVPCAPITDLGQGRFGWTDGQGTNVSWRAVARSPELCIWLAEGHARMGNLLPVVPAKAVAVLHYTRHTGIDGQPFITHEVDIYLQTDSKAAALITRLLGPAAPRLAEQGAEQLLLFFAGLSRYVEVHPDEAPTLLAK